MESNDLLLANCLASNLLYLIIMPTEQCNFRCTYCYEDFELGRMAPGVVNGLKRFLDRRAPDLDQLSLAWFGGEPLLAFDVVADVQDHAQSLAYQHPRLHVSASMTTNAFHLDRHRLRRLLDLGVREYQISFDGPRELHDCKRVQMGGQGTFDRIWGNLLAARELSADFVIRVRLHLDRENYDAIPQFLEEYRQTFGGDRRFLLFMRPLSRLGGPNDGELATFELEEGRDAVAEMNRRARAMGIVAADREEHGEDLVEVCYAARANSLVIRSDGSLAKCTVAFSRGENRVGWLREDGHVDLDAEKMARWMRGIWSGDREELECPMIGYADGSLPAADSRPEVHWHGSAPAGRR